MLRLLIEEQFVKDIAGSCHEYFLTCFLGVCLEELKKTTGNFSEGTGIQEKSSRSKAEQAC